MKKFLACTLLGASIFTLAACNKTEKNYINLKVTDLDGEILVDEKVYYNGDTNAFDLIHDKYMVEYTTSEYGPYIVSLNNTIVDGNYSLSLYVDGKISPVGIGSVQLENKMSIEFKNECWNTLESGWGIFDEYDVKVDTAIYHYIKTTLEDRITSAKSYKDVMWEFMFLKTYNSLYHNNVIDNKFTEIKDEISAVDLSTLSAADFGKYYYAASALEMDLSAFKEAYKQNIDALTDLTYSEWTTPFYTSPAKKLEITSENLNTLINTTYRAGTDWGYDGVTWQLTNLALFDKDISTDLANIALSKQANGTSTALLLLPFAATNTSVRTESADLIKILFDNFYDENKKELFISEIDEKNKFSINQIYTSLLAYKVSRDFGNKCNIFE